MISSIFSYILHVCTVTFYFFYYLFKGKKEWKEQDQNPCEKTPPSCCLHANLRNADVDAANEPAKPSPLYDNYSPKAKPWFDRVKAVPRTVWSWIRQLGSGIRRRTPSVRNVGSSAWNGAKYTSKKVWTGIKGFFSWLFSKPALSKSIDESETTPLSASGTFRSIDQSDIYDEQNGEESQAATLAETACAKPFVKQHSEEELVEFGLDTLQQHPQPYEHEQHERSAAPTPPPPPIRSSVPPKGGIPVLPPNLIQDTSSRQYQFDQQYSPPPPPIPESPRTIHSERAASSFSFRSVQENGRPSEEPSKWSTTSTTTKRQQQQDIVSRIPRPNGEDAQFIFRSRPRPQYIDADSSFMMGRSVYKPLEEAERMRTEINRRSESRMSSSRMNTPFEPIIDSRMSTPSVTHASYYRAIPTPTPSLRLRSRTVEPSSAGPSVRDLSERWPPRSNATGPPPVKDNFLDFEPETTVTSCRRVIERKVEDKWIERDEEGAAMQEWGSKSWTGQIDQIERNGPRTMSESKWMHVDPQGKTSFHNVNRQCDGHSVIESVVRNVY